MSKVFAAVAFVAVSVFAGVSPVSAETVGSREWECQQLNIRCNNDTQQVESATTTNVEVGSREWECQQLGIRCN